ncbi:hypothetical protein Patl1_19571 [Pistacia atlantica]|uniref:Uncharacterized protein n=1 Tax=Pistacia atlantica TaxID=434234 RepID=A0ACC1BYA3_9ROSI|nr:hypothetical protein Patl1_19571 [Pistacia atlantica]
MVFKSKLFFSSKKSSDSDGSNSPRSFGSNSPIGSDKKKPKSGSKDDPTQIASSPTSSFGGVSCRQTQVKDGVKKKEVKGKETTSSLTPTVSTSTTTTKSSPTKQKEVASAVSPILASSLGLNRIKTRSGPLPQESFFSFKGDKAAASNLSRGGGDGNLSSGKSLASGSGSGKKKMGFNESAGGDGGSISGQSREQSPSLLAKSRLQSGESSSEAATKGQCADISL